MIDFIFFKIKADDKIFIGARRAQLGHTHLSSTACPPSAGKARPKGWAGKTSWIWGPFGGVPRLSSRWGLRFIYWVLFVSLFMFGVLVSISGQDCARRAQWENTIFYGLYRCTVHDGCCPSNKISSNKKCIEVYRQLAFPIPVAAVGKASCTGDLFKCP